MAEETARYVAALRARFSGKQNGEELLGIQIECLLVGVCELVTTLEDVDKLKEDELVEAMEIGYARAGRGDMSHGLRLRFERYLGRMDSTKAVGPGQTPTGAKGDPAAMALAALRIGPAGSVCGSGMGRAADAETEIEAQLIADFPELTNDARLLQIAVEDCKRQGLTGKQSQRISFSLEIGRVAGEGEVEHAPYFGDPRGATWVSKVCKWEKKTGSKLLDAGNLLGYLALVNNLIRDYTRQGCPIEATVLSEWMGETMGGFKGDDKAMLFYFEEYRRTYVGRGIPVAWDPRMATHATNETRAVEGKRVTQDDVRTGVREGVAGVAAQNAELKMKLVRLEARLDQVAAKAGNPPPSGGGGAGGAAGAAAAKAKRLANTTCHKCQQKGHYARDCPTKEDDEDE